MCLYWPGLLHTCTCMTNTQQPNVNKTISLCPFYYVYTYFISEIMRCIYTWIETGVPRINTYPENNEKSHESWATAYTVRGGHNNIPTNMWAHGYTHTGVHTQVYMTWIVYACWCAMWHIKFIAINQMKCRTLWVSLHVRAVSTCN